MFAAGFVGLLAGAVAGWSARPPDLLAQASSARPISPALWLATDWARIERKAGPAEQYRHALLMSSAADREAAWVAVSGYFPQDHEWASRSYTQIARELFRKRDRPRLEALAAVLGSTNSGRHKVLAEVMNAAVASFESDEVEKVLILFASSDHSFIKNLLDASVADFGLEVVVRVRDDPPLQAHGDRRQCAPRGPEQADPEDDRDQADRPQGLIRPRRPIGPCEHAPNPSATPSLPPDPVDGVVRDALPEEDEPRTFRAAFRDQDRLLRDRAAPGLPRRPRPQRDQPEAHRDPQARRSLGRGRPPLRNFTFLNGRKIDPDEPPPALSANDRIKICEVEFAFYHQIPPRKSPAPPTADPTRSRSRRARTRSPAPSIPWTPRVRARSPAR